MCVCVCLCIFQIFQPPTSCCSQHHHHPSPSPPPPTKIHLSHQTSWRCKADIPEMYAPWPDARKTLHLRLGDAL